MTTDRARARLRSEVPTMPPRMFCMLRATALKPISLPERLDEEGFARARRSDEDDALGHVAQAILAHWLDDLGLRPCLELLHAADDLEAVWSGPSFRAGRRIPGR